MKIKEILEIINKDNEYKERINFLNNKLSGYYFYNGVPCNLDKEPLLLKQKEKDLIKHLQEQLKLITEEYNRWLQSEVPSSNKGEI